MSRNQHPTFRNQWDALVAAQEGGFHLSVGDGTFWAFRKDSNSPPFYLDQNRDGTYQWERKT